MRCESPAQLQELSFEDKFYLYFESTSVGGQKRAVQWVFFG